MYAFKKAVEAAGSKETGKVVEALAGMELDSPAGHRVFRKEDHQAMYEVPWGLTKADPQYPFKIMGKQQKNFSTDHHSKGPGRIRHLRIQSRHEKAR